MITLYRFLDWLRSRCNYSLKAFSGRRRWGSIWKDMVRPGRTYTHVEYIEPTKADMEGFYSLRREPGWEWTCPNCNTYSLVSLRMMPEILAEWEQRVANVMRQGFKKLPAKPTQATAGCTNCKFLPGPPE